MTGKKSNRGRPKGATSFVRIALCDLLDQLGEKATVVVSKKWLESIGLDVTSESKPSPVDEVKKEDEVERIQFTIHND
jgi:hypothetical protein|tara:strand:- start:170 stop:403 length:234 start_codon:yes stop_codon:yes gene_type:complete